ncbi:MAG TPA: hypothetical protein VJ044_12390 [Candidatus Hodarchaeales archaeon]|nr:hypothetical protein [Candidatus Hodarchaeales archaeon]
MNFKLEDFKAMRLGRVEKDEEIPIVEIETEVDDEKKLAEKEVAKGEAKTGELSIEERIAAVRAELLEAQTSDSASKTAEEKKAAEEKKEDTLPTVEFITAADDIEAIIEDREALNLAFNRVYQQGIKDARETVKREVTQLRAELGPHIQQQVQQEIALRDALVEFSDKNPELMANYPKNVVKAANEIANENPTWKLSQIFTEVPKRVRKNLGLSEKPTESDEKKEVATQGDSKKKPPISIKGSTASRRVEDILPKKTDNSVAGQLRRMKLARQGLLQ